MRLLLAAVLLLGLIGSRLWKGRREQSKILHIKPKVSFKDRGAVIQIPSSVSTSVVPALPCAAVGSPFPSDRTITREVPCVGGPIHRSKIAQSVVKFVVVDVINFVRHFIMDKKPSKPVRVVLPLSPPYLPVTPTGATRALAGSNPKQMPSVRVIAQDFTNRIGDTFTSHFKLPLDLVRGLRIAVLSTPILSLALSGCTSVEERDAHMQSQIRMVQVQKEADSKLAIAEANAKMALYDALADVARTNPEQASAVVVAMAIQGVGKEGEAGDSRLVSLQPLQNETLEYARVFAAPLMNVTSAVATAYINADVAKTQSDNAARVQINDAITDSKIVEAVAEVGIAAAETSGLFVSGDNYALSDSASISQDQISNVAETTTTTETTTSSELADSYNTTDNSTDNTDNSVVTYGGQEWTVRGLVEFFQSTGEPYVLTVGDNTYTDTDASGEGQTCVPTFDGYVCTGE